MAENENSKKRKGKIYSTAVIDQLIADRNQGFEIDYEPFFMRDLDLRAANIPFRMTEEEIDEYQKCFDDPVYYAENYAKFMTDHGLSIVKLRDYQENIIQKVTEEKYDPENDLLLPVNRHMIICASRQTGKCGFYCMKINELQYSSDLSEMHPNEISIGYKYNKEYNKKRSFSKKIFCKIKTLLYKIYVKI